MTFCRIVFRQCVNFTLSRGNHTNGLDIHTYVIGRHAPYYARVRHAESTRHGDERVVSFNIKIYNVRIQVNIRIPGSSTSPCLHGTPFFAALSFYYARVFLARDSITAFAKVAQAPFWIR